jgi:lipopolysaccharide/colanic/teichoic acid biosynthesis glycosyltransferase
VAVRGGPSKTPWLVAKRGLDIFGASLGLIVLSPVFAAVGVAILAGQGRPVLFRQPRVGLRGRVFDVVKFRTMTPGADAERAELRRFNEVSGGASFKMTNDPGSRGSEGSWRRTSVDELPQLWNVLRGEMSLVGPRSPTDDVAGYDSGTVGAWR